MAQGGKREGAGRKKVDRPTNNVVADRVLQKANAEQLWLSMIALERRRLGIADDGKLLPTAKGAITGPDYQGRFSIIPLSNILRYLEDRKYGRPVDTVNHLHDKPLEVNATVSIRGALDKALQRSLKR
jgi:hypothetical protein